MLGGGVVESGCGGFLFACCHRTGQAGHAELAERVSFYPQNKSKLVIIINIPLLTVLHVLIFKHNLKRYNFLNVTM